MGGLVGIVLAMAVTGPLNDWGIVWISKRNRGIYEPEFRLVFMASMLFGVFGYVGWAAGNFYPTYVLSEVPTNDNGVWTDTALVSACLVPK